MMKKIIAVLVSGIAVLTIAGCGGDDLSGKYVAEPVSDKDTITYVLDVKKGEKDGYVMDFCTAKYKMTKSKGPDDRYYSPIFNTTCKKSVYDNVFNGKFKYEIDTQLLTSAPDKNKTMIFKRTKENFFTMGAGPGTLTVDKDGNLVDTVGSLTSTEGRKFVKVKELDMNEIKKNLQESTTKSLQKEYVREDAFSVSKISGITFED